MFEIFDTDGSIKVNPYKILSVKNILKISDLESICVSIIQIPQCMTPKSFEGLYIFKIDKYFDTFDTFDTEYQDIYYYIYDAVGNKLAHLHP